MKPDKVEERFLKELCRQDTDGKWFLNSTPDTVPKILQFITQYHQDLMNEVVERIDEWENEARANGEMKLISDLKQTIIKSK